MAYPTKPDIYSSKTIYMILDLKNWKTNKNQTNKQKNHTTNQQGALLNDIVEEKTSGKIIKHLHKIHEVSEKSNQYRDINGKNFEIICQCTS